MDVKETPEAIVFTADVPGIEESDITVQVDETERVLTVRGKRDEYVVDQVDDDTTKKPKEEEEKEEAEEKEGTKKRSSSSEPAVGGSRGSPATRYHRRERHFGSFENRCEKRACSRTCTLALRHIVDPSLFVLMCLFFKVNNVF